MKKAAGRATPPLPWGVEGEDALNLGTYIRSVVTNVGGGGISSSSSTTGSTDATTTAIDVVVGGQPAGGGSRGRLYFDLGLRLLFAYQHEQACKLFLACLWESPDCAMAHAMVALCHGPNYNFKGEAYYDSTDHPEQLYLDKIILNQGGGGGGDAGGATAGIMTAEIAALDEMMNVFPSQQVATKHARAAMDKVEELARRASRVGRKRSASVAAANAGNGAGATLEDAGGSTGGDTAAAAAPAVLRGGVGGGDNTSRSRDIVDDDDSMARSQGSMRSVVMVDANDGGGGGGGGGGDRSSDIVHIVMEDADGSSSTNDHGGPAIPSSSSPPSAYSSTSQPISEVEVDILKAIAVLCAHPGIDPALSMDTVGRPYANAMREVYRKHPNDAEVAYFFAESLMVLNAWSLYEYPSGRPLTSDVFEIREVLERGLTLHPEHAGLCHLYVHLSEMSDDPGKALPACMSLRMR